ncbi:MAG: hypothetical protein U9N36_11665 [Euryarchaeota archaeon]|nr:hypothetical protein [Euryarchaeota archaeon]
MSELSKRLPDDNEKTRTTGARICARIACTNYLIPNIMTGSKDNPEREFYCTYRKLPKVQLPVAQIEWRGNLALLDKPEDPNMEVATLMATIKMNVGGLGI